MKDVNTPRPKVCVMTSRRRVERSIEHVSKCTKTSTSPPPEGMCGMCDHAKKPCLDADEGNEHIKKCKNTEFATGGGRINYGPTLCN